MKIIVPDTGALIDGRISEMAERVAGDVRVIIPQAAVAELEHQANANKEEGFAGLAELTKLGDMAKRDRIEIMFTGNRPKYYEIDGAGAGEIDALIRAEAKLYDGALLVTTDKVQAAVAAAEGIAVEYLDPVMGDFELPFVDFFKGGDVMSLHIKDGEPARVKRGKPGAFLLSEFSSKRYSRAEIEALMRSSIEFTKRDSRSFLELDKAGATVIQAREYRITFTRPPFSESCEITVVRPIVKLELSDYALSPTLANRLSKQAEGIIVAGPPGNGKSTFVTALAESYAASNKIVKTFEQPRDLQVSRSITQYAPLEGSFENAYDILLLVRPDYTIFDEVRKATDFRVFADLRMAGVGMVGVVHASKPIDAVQRFFGKVEMGLIPQIVDTVVFIEKGRVAKAYSLGMLVRTPHGMTERDLARPVIEISDLETGELEYEIYKYGEETVVSPLGIAARENRFARMPVQRAGYEDDYAQGGRPKKFFKKKKFRR